jgi:hypothetical protein
VQKSNDDHDDGQNGTAHPEHVICRAFLPLAVNHTCPSPVATYTTQKLISPNAHGLSGTDTLHGPAPSLLPLVHGSVFRLFAGRNWAI